MAFFSSTLFVTIPRFNIFVNYRKKHIEYSLVINIIQEDIFFGKFLLKRVGRKGKNGEREAATLGFPPTTTPKGVTMYYRGVALATPTITYLI